MGPAARRDSPLPRSADAPGTSQARGRILSRAGGPAPLRPKTAAWLLWISVGCADRETATKESEASTDGTGETGGPTDVDAGGPAASIIDVAGATTHACALTDEGWLKCWGDSTQGALGYSDWADVGGAGRPLPSDVGTVETGMAVSQVALSGHQTCALLAGGDLLCWGYGPLPGSWYASQPEGLTPAAIVPVQLGQPAIHVALGVGGCAVLEDRTIRCWGADHLASPGFVEDIGDDENPADAPPLDLGGPVVATIVGFHNACALMSSGSVRCWGQSDPYLGYGLGFDENIGDDETPADAGDVPLGERATKLVGGKLHACAMLADATVRCWGAFAGGLGYAIGSSDVGMFDTPVDHPPVQLGGNAVDIAVADTMSCALLDSGGVRCWGGFGYPIGYGNLETIGDDEHPADAGDVPVGGSVASIHGGGTRMCALIADGGVRCWGEGHAGLGYGSDEPIGDDDVPEDWGDIPLY